MKVRRLLTVIDPLIETPVDKVVSYSYDEAGNILTKTDRLGKVNYSDRTTVFNESYSYDSVGNRLTHANSGITHAYEYYPNSNRLKAIHTDTLTGAVEKSYTYNDAGQLISQTGLGAKTLNWDQKGRPTSITATGMITNTYAYDPMDRRINKNDSHGNQSALLEGDHLEAIYSGANLQAKYMRGTVIDEIVNGYQYDLAGNWTNATYHHDRLQSVMGLSGHDGTVLTTQTYTTFGENQTGTGTSNNTLRYTGREQDSDTGLYQYRARYYDPAIGRFISEDPKGFGAGVNFYAYTNNNPVNANDPSGEAPGPFANPSFQPHVPAPRLTISHAVPADAVLYKTSNGQTFYAPPNTDFNAIYQAGQAGGINPIAGSDAIAHFGKYDFQRDANQKLFISAYTDASNFAVGAYMNGAGFSLKGTTVIANTFAYTMSSNAGAAAQSTWWTNGWGAANSNFSNVQPIVTTPPVSGKPGNTSFNDILNYAPSAAGGFLLYPNKPNTNQMTSVYAK